MHALLPRHFRVEGGGQQLAGTHCNNSSRPVEGFGVAGLGRFHLGKDFDAVRRGLFGRIVSDDVTSLVLAQQTQGWALAGETHSLRYAYDPDPDGSYTLLNRMANDLLSQRDWPGRLKWLRAAGVGSLIASDVVPGTPGLVPVATEKEIGVPVTLYAIASPLPGVRRLSRVFGSKSPREAVARFDRSDFDPGTDGVVSGDPPFEGGGVPDTDAAARVVAEGPDALEIETSGSRAGLLHVDRSFTPRIVARVNGAVARPVPLDLHLTGIPVPPGASRVSVDLAP